MTESGAFSYLAMKTARQLYAKAPAALNDSEQQKVIQLARRQHALEERVLASPEAAGVSVPEPALQAALAEVLGRYADATEMEADLAGNGLNPDDYAAALERELRVNAVLDHVTARDAPVSDVDAELYYRYHPDQFRRPETRIARHIMVTVNEDLPDNGHAAAHARIGAIAARLAKDPKRFEEQAVKHSECPTALNGGLLGEVRAGQLYPELDAVLFALEPMALSGILVSPMGFHVLRCDAIHPAGAVPLAKAKAKIHKYLQEKRRQTTVRNWLKELRTEAAMTE